MSDGTGYARPPGGGAGRHDEALAQALYALNGQRPQEAERIAGGVLKSDPRHARALHIFGCALLLQGRAEEAVAPLESAARGRHDPEIDTQLAVALRRAGRVDDALHRLKLGTKRKPPYPPAFRELGNLLVFMQRFEEAAEVLRRGLAVAPLMPELSIQLGYTLLSLRRNGEAQAAFAHALGISPASPDALYGMAKALQEVGDNPAAEGYFRRYLITMPGDQNAWLSLGHCLLELGRLDAGFECFRTAARGDAQRYGDALTSLSAAARGRFWLKPSDATRFLRGEKASAPVSSASAPGIDDDKSRSRD
jgi:tetratricopeptide (TPR) repeat protein